MKSDCSCGARNAPWAERCGKCNRVLQTPAEASARKREWDALSPEMRASMESEFTKAGERSEQARVFRRRRLIVLSISAAIAFPLLLELVPPKMAGLGSIIAAPIGAGAALAYHLLGPGAVRGAAIFGAAYLVATFVKLPFCETSPMFWHGQWIHSAIVTFIVAMLGWGVGFSDSEDR